MVLQVNAQAISMLWEPAASLSSTPPNISASKLRCPETLPLNDREVVLTFDDGPLPPYTTRILDTLASNCAKATFFIVGRMASSSPELVRRAYREGHTIGTHTENHPINIASLPTERTEREIGTALPRSREHRRLRSTRTPLSNTGSRTYRADSRNISSRKGS